jgi:hypothetical protein
MQIRADQLEERVEAKRLELRARLAKLKAETRHDSVPAKDAVLRSLAELDETLTAGWDTASDEVRAKLGEWLERHGN